MKELQPANQNLVLDITSAGEERTASGIIIPSMAKEKPRFAKIVWMGIIDNAEVKPGDTVIYKPYSGTELQFEGKTYLILPYSEVLAKIVETDEI